ncbi:MAG: tyrosine-type recombinase/integrase [Paludibacter sp.]|jgi:integrase|nr:tyrosine-type recombinase/integrase [Paludibacter sp.]
MRHREATIYPYLNNKGGDLAKQWYVEYQFSLPDRFEPIRERVYKTINGSADERYAAAQKIIADKTRWLDNKEYIALQSGHNYLKRYSDSRISGRMSVLTEIETDINDFLERKKQQVNAKSFICYTSKMRVFVEWLKVNEYLKREITTRVIEDFAFWLSKTQGLSKVTIDKYMQIVGTFFDYEVLKNKLRVSPVIGADIHSYGAVVDKAAVPYSDTERATMKDVISRANPYLWLACQIQYYCAIRPGELRTLKIGNIDLQRKTIRVSAPDAKNQTTEMVDIPDVLVTEFSRFGLEKYNQDFYLFGRYGVPSATPTGKNTMRNRFNEFRKQAGLPENKKFYSWKHTGAIILIQNGASPYNVMEHLRHKNFATTEKYLRKRAVVGSRRVNEFVVPI